jgi:hypothetical protein
VLEPPTVVEAGDHFELAAGERRLRAARMAGLKTIPVSIRHDGDRTQVTAAENDHREGLDHVAIGRQYKAIAEEFNLTTRTAVAEHSDVTRAWVSSHLRLLDLPEGVQRYIAEGTVPFEAEPPLRAISEVSPRVAECVCEMAKRRKVKPSRFVASFGDLLAEAPEARFEHRPTMIPVVHVPVRRAVADPEGRRKIVARLADVYPHQTIDDAARLSFSGEEIDAARAAQCLIEYKSGTEAWVRTLRFITDAELAADLVDRAVGRIETEVADHRRRIEEAERRAKAQRQGTDPDAGADRQAEERKAKAAERKKLKADAEASNEEIGLRLIKARGGRARKQRSMVRFRVVAGLFLDAYPELAGRGLRLVLPQLREVESKRLKSGESRQKITYAGREQATEFLAARLAEADSPEEGLELLTEAVVAASLADEDAVPQADRIGYRTRVGQATTEALAADVKAATPRKRGEQK